MSQPATHPVELEAIKRDQDYPRPAVAVDLVIFTILDADLKVLLIDRIGEPFAGQPALPGGFVRVKEPADADNVGDQGEDLEDAVLRELEEETGLPHGSVFFEQLRTYGKAGRDPRMRVFSVAHVALVRPDLAGLAAAGGDAKNARWVSVRHERPERLAFDHDTILDDALTYAQSRLDTSSIAFELVPPTFSMTELRSVHEVIRGEGLDRGNFRRRFLRMIDDGVVEQAPGKRITGRKPAAVYRFLR